MSLDTSSVAICTACNDGYFPLMEDWLAALEDAGVFPRLPVRMYDVGLSPAQRDALTARGVVAKTPEWGIDFPARGRSPAWFRAMTARPFLPEVFEGFEAYVWLDVDTWLLDGAMIDDLVSRASDGAIPLAHTEFGPPLQVPLPGTDRLGIIGEQSIRQAVSTCYEKCFGSEYADRGQQPIINSGVFAIRRDSGVWATWKQYLARALAGGALHKLAEQQALNLAVLDGTVPSVKLPTTMNWNVATLLPRYDAASKRLVDPRDAAPIQLFHLTDLKHLQFFDLRGSDGEIVRFPLRYRKARAFLGR